MLKTCLSLLLLLKRLLLCLVYDAGSSRCGSFFWVFFVIFFLIYDLVPSLGHCRDTLEQGADPVFVPQNKVDLVG